MADELESLQDEDIYAQPDEELRLVALDVAGGIARITLRRAPANVLSVDMLGELVRALESLEYEREVKLIVLAGDGKYFSAGYELAEHLGERSYIMIEHFRRVFELLARLDKPSFAIVAGPALGAGCLLAAGCDIVYAGAGAKLGFPEPRAGVFNTVAAALLPRIVGRRRAMELLLLGQGVGAAEAERIGLVTRVIADEKLEAEAAALIARFEEGSAVVYQCIRKAVAGGLDLMYEDAIRHAEDVYLNQLMTSEDGVEGLQAVLAKRKPEWKNR